MKTLEPYMLEIFRCFHWALPTKAKGFSMRVQALGRQQQNTKTLKPHERKQLRNEAAARGPNVAFSCNGKNLHMHGRLKDFLNGFRDSIAFQGKHGKS